MMKLFIECFEDMHKGLVFAVTMTGEIIISVSKKMTEIITGNR